MRDSRSSYRREWYLAEFADDVADLLDEGEEEEEPFARLRFEKKAVQAIYSRFAGNAGDNDKHVLTPPEVDMLLAFTAETAGCLSDETLDSRISGVPEHFRRYLRIIRGDAPTVIPAVEIRSLMYVDGCLRIEGFFTDPLLPADGSVSPFLRIGERRIELPDTPLKKEFRYFSRRLVSYRTFEIALAPAEISPGSELRFFVPGSAETYTSTRIVFTPPQARLSPALGCTYTEIERGAGCDPATCPPIIAVKYVQSPAKDTAEDVLDASPPQDFIRIVKPGPGKRFASELRAFKGLLTAKKTNGGPATRRQKIDEGALRLLFHLTHPFFARHPPVLYFDKLYMGGDNGQYLFEHAARLDGETGVRSHYVVGKDTPAFRELKAKGLRVIDYGSPLRKLYALNARLICATHANALAFCGLNKFERRWFAHLLKSHVVCIQHGLTVQYIPQYQARIVDNTERYYLAAGAERTNLLRPEYGYAPEQLRMTGLARYDGLIPDTQKVILFAPTWRRSATRQATRMGSMRRALTAFRDTDYFQICVDLLTDSRLARGLQERGYTLRFLVHPTVTAHARDFEEAIHSAPPAPPAPPAPAPPAPSPVEVVAAPEEGYEPHLREAALLITDYSGIQFDCTYMGTPVLYYLPPELPPNYAPGGFDPTRDGFGPVCRKQEELIAALLEMLDNGLHSEERYAERVRDFFAFHDRSNCQRLYEAIRSDYDLH